MKNIFQPNAAMMMSDATNSSEWRTKQRVADMLNRYGDAKQFLDLFNPELQTVAAREWVRAYTGTAPTLETVVQGYGEATAVVWLCVELENINLFAGVREKMSVARQKELSKLILAEYGYLRVTELLLFFHRLKCGRYGRFYGSVDALFISAALLQFTSERHNDLKRIRAAKEKQEEKPADDTSGCITYDEYLRLKSEKEGPP